ncbi:hypothetical protein [Micromonospora sp. DT47]|uniref:hypothetical protein n=1 Tax=Micromonospora sp. DT47 TaxID=3393431 RepID=UPI003CF104C0
MSWDVLTLAAAGLLATRRYKRGYTGKRRAQRAAPADHRLSPAAYQTHTGTAEHVPADEDQPTGLLRVRRIHPTGQFTLPSVDRVHTGATR